MEAMEPGRIKVWQCAGCGRIDDPKPCVGVCRDEKVEYVLAAEHDARMKELLALVRVIATTTPRDGEWERSWRALQERGRALVGTN
jgi:hypothetical protein